MKDQDSMETYLAGQEMWLEEQKTIISIAALVELEATLKWGVPCFCYQNHPLILIRPFSNQIAIMFFKGAYMVSKEGLPLKSKAAKESRHLYFTSLEEIKSKEADLLAYFQEARALVEGNLIPPRLKEDSHEIPDELLEAFYEDTRFEEAFYALSPGKQKFYLHYIGSGKKTTTRQARVTRCMPRIFEGLGPNDG